MLVRWRPQHFGEPFNRIGLCRWYAAIHLSCSKIASSSDDGKNGFRTVGFGTSSDLDMVSDPSQEFLTVV